ncbi:NAD(P)-dependent oxidoreductase [Cyanobium sp. ATX 6A2]|uniref:NAD(P)-dependent oxidoreductase n=1 Tax=Cyanobium sp. ATX 6A2 TaxID=2823700 RepID=UPI0020CF918E|nr:NAD(P)-dependent oxidoreductase [Cyanobium sp. ATX 6A2]MCP9888326.1 NAD(P)-dependent oxidoreductase [Cyanobium sp. ATX 6A2]
MAGTVTVALLGTGLLGAAIGQRLLEQGLGVQAWNRSPERLGALAALGAIGCREPQQALEGCDWVITVLSDGAATRSVLQRCDLQDQRVLQMGTIAPAESRELGTVIGAAGGDYLEVPVLGSRPEALSGSLQVMAAGPAALFEQALPLLKRLDPEPRLLGPLGAALETKLALNQLIASLTHAFSLSLHLVQSSGVEVEHFMELLRGSALYAPTFDKKLPRLLADNYDQPNFPTAHLRKDLLLFLAAARQRGLDTRGLRGLAELLSAAEGSAIDGLDYSALHRLTAKTAAWS